MGGQLLNQAKESEQPAALVASPGMPGQQAERQLGGSPSSRSLGHAGVLGAGEGMGEAPTHFANAVLAEVLVVAKDDYFAGHGCTDAQPIVNLKSKWGGNRSRGGENVTTGNTGSQSPSALRVVWLGCSLCGGGPVLGTLEPLAASLALPVAPPSCGTMATC